MFFYLRDNFIVAFFSFIHHNESMIRKDKAFTVIVVLEILFIIAASLWIWIVYTNNNIQTSYYVIEDYLIPKEFDGFKIAHVSDLHNKDWKDRLCDLIEKEKPDIIAITGDIVDSSDVYYDISLQFIEKALNIAPVYFVTGNHESYMQDYKSLQKKMSDAGVIIMDDKSFLIKKGDCYINLIGLQDPSFTQKSAFLDNSGSILREKIVSLKEDDLYNVLLSHRPEYMDYYADAGVNLVLSGHAHGGQIILPFIGGLIAPGQGFFPEYTQGVHTKENTNMVISRGIGDSYLPRVNNMPELVIITLKSL